MKKLILTVAGFILASTVSAQPVLFNNTEALNFIVPVPVGGTYDKVARSLQRPLQDALGKTIVVNNIPGANCTIGAREVNNYRGRDVKALILGTANVIYNEQIEAMTDMVPVYYLGAVSETVFARPNLKYNTAAELVRNSTERLTMGAYSQGGDGSSVFKSASKKDNIDLIYYKGSAQAMIDVISGNLDLATAPPVNVKGAVDGGKIKLLGINGSQRHPDFPGVATMQEQGISIPQTLKFYILVNKSADPENLAQFVKALDLAAKSEEFVSAKKFINLFSEPVRGPVAQHFQNSVNSVYDVIGKNPVKSAMQ